MLSQVTGTWLADLDGVVLCVASLLSQVLLVERSALRVGSVANLSKDTLRLGL